MLLTPEKDKNSFIYIYSYTCVHANAHTNIPTHKYVLMYSEICLKQNFYYMET